MSRTPDHINRISDSFDALAPDAQVDILAELFTRIDQDHQVATVRLMRFWQSHEAGRAKRKRVKIETAGPELMAPEEVKQCGDLALTEGPEQ